MTSTGLAEFLVDIESHYAARAVSAVNLEHLGDEGFCEGEELVELGDGSHHHSDFVDQAEVINVDEVDTFELFAVGEFSDEEEGVPVVGGNDSGVPKRVGEREDSSGDGEDCADEVSAFERGVLQWSMEGDMFGERCRHGVRVALLDSGLKGGGHVVLP